MAEISEMRDAKFVIDGSALLHRVYWKSDSSFMDVVFQRVVYIKNNFGDACTVVFDGYQASTKDHEHSRRKCGRAAAYTKITENLIVPDNQQAFLKNDLNKTQFIAMFLKDLKEAGHYVYQSDDDADIMIAKRALTLLNSDHNTVVVSDGIDILVLLIHYCDGHDFLHDIYFLSYATKKSKTGLQMFRIRDIMESIGQKIVKNILFSHAWSGCDTTSATFGQDKVALLKHAKSNEYIRSTSQLFYATNATAEEISTAGQKLFVLMYGGKDKNLNELRYHRYMSAVASSNLGVRPEKLPPTECAAKYHYRYCNGRILLRSSLLKTGVGKLKVENIFPT